MNAAAAPIFAIVELAELILINLTSDELSDAMEKYREVSEAVAASSKLTLLAMGVVS